MTTVMDLCTDALRGLIVAPPGRKLVVSDLQGIEGRVLPWLAGEDWKLEAIREFDAGFGPDMYRLAYARPFGVDPNSISSFERQMGKGMELSMGYGGGVGAFVSVSANYKLDLDEMTAAAWDKMPREVMGQAGGMWEWAVKKNKTLGLRREVYMVCDALKQMWRNAHPATVDLWAAYENAYRQATLNPGKVFRAGRCAFARTGNWLRVRLPSGRELCYASPRVSDKGELSYMGMNQYSRKWQRLKTYGGKLTENIDQAVARDIMDSAMGPAEEAGYDILLTVHDELITETPDSPDFTHEALSEILATNPPWADGLPLAAGGFESYRYRKD